MYLLFVLRQVRTSEGEKRQRAKWESWHQCQHDLNVCACVWVSERMCPRMVPVSRSLMCVYSCVEHSSWAIRAEQGGLNLHPSVLEEKRGEKEGEI